MISSPGCAIIKGYGAVCINVPYMGNSVAEMVEVSIMECFVV